MADRDTLFRPVATWSDANRYTASGDTDIILSSSGAGTLYFWRTTDDTEPTEKPSNAHPIKSGDYRAIELANGQRLWLAGAASIAVLGV